MNASGAEIRAAVLAWLVRNGEPLRGARGELTLDMLERMGMRLHLNGHREMLSVRRPVRAREIFTRWLDGVPDGGCELMFDSMTWTDSSWTVWNSFDESGWTERGVDVDVFCKCGRIAGTVWRYEGTWGDLLRGITEG